jgi:hypothetical protein
VPDKTAVPYELPFPLGDDVADVPYYIAGLANRLQVVLDSKLQKTDYTNGAGAAVSGTDTLYQKKVTVQTGIPTVATTGKEGDIIIVVST